MKMLILVLPQIALILLAVVISNARPSSFACTLTPGGNMLLYGAPFFPPQTHLHSTMDTHRRCWGPTRRRRPTIWWSHGQIAGHRKGQLARHESLMLQGVGHMPMFKKKKRQTHLKMKN